MTQPRPLYADDYETITIRSPKKFGLVAAIAKAAKASGETRETLVVSRLRTSLGLSAAGERGRS